jgi:glycerol kinase
MAGYILALDQGTTSSRAILYDDHARPIKMVQQPTTLQTPRAGFVELRLAVHMMLLIGQGCLPLTLPVSRLPISVSQL